MRVVLAGIIGRYPFGGVAWCSLMYLLGLRALGHEVFYIEDTGECGYDPDRNTISEDPGYALRHIRATLAPHGLGDRWALVNYDGRYYGASRAQVAARCAEADVLLDLSGGCWFWRDEYRAIPRRAFIDSDPAFTQIWLARTQGPMRDFFDGFDRLFTFGANIPTGVCEVPSAGLTWLHTWQPVVLAQWATDAAPADRRFTTVMTWKIKSFADTGGNKDQEFLRFIDLPARVGDRFTLAVNGPHDLLRAHGWRTADGMALSRTSGSYRDFVRSCTRSSASPSTPTSGRTRGGSAIARPATWRRADQPSCRIRAGRRTCRPARASWRSARPRRRSTPWHGWTPTTRGTRGGRARSPTITSTPGG